MTHQGSHTSIIGGGEPFYALISIVMPDLKPMVKQSSKTILSVGLKKTVSGGCFLYRPFFYW
jgi:hypothetical protein